MASLRNLTPTGASHDNVVPAHVFEQKRRERAERVRVARSTIVAQADEQAEATQ